MRAQNDAAANYKAKCAGCHGPDGSGGTPAGKALSIRDFHSPDVQKETVADLAAIISSGKNKMPKYSDKLKDAEINIAKHVRVASGVGYRVAVAGGGEGPSSRDMSSLIIRSSLIFGSF